MQDPIARAAAAHCCIVAAVFLVPVAVAFTLYYGKLWRPADSASKGQLIDPARPLTVAGLRHAGRHRRRTRTCSRANGHSSI